MTVDVNGDGHPDPIPRADGVDLLLGELEKTIESMLGRVLSLEDLVGTHRRAEGLAAATRRRMDELIALAGRSQG